MPSSAVDKGKMPFFKLLRSSLKMVVSGSNVLDPQKMGMLSIMGETSAFSSVNTGL